MSRTTVGADIRARIADLIDEGSAADVAVTERLVRSFLQRQAGLLDRLADAVAEGDTDGAAYHAHALKGAAGNMGATVVTGLCAEAEELATAADRARLAGYPNLLRSALADASEELNLALAELRTCYQLPVPQD